MPCSSPADFSLDGEQICIDVIFTCSGIILEFELRELRSHFQRLRFAFRTLAGRLPTLRLMVSCLSSRTGKLEETRLGRYLLDEFPSLSPPHD